MGARIHRLTAMGAAGGAILGTYLVIGVPEAESGSSPRCFGKPATIVGSNGDSNIRGTNGADVIVAKNGENDVNGRAGKDRICGGEDGDDIFGGRGDDRMASRGSTDFIAGRQGDDLHIAGGGGDQIDAVQDSLATDDDIVRGKNGDDFLDVFDGEGNDSVSGGGGAADDCPADAGDLKSASCEI